MKTLSQLSNTELLVQTQTLAAEDRRLTQEVLLHLQEIEGRGLHLLLGYGSLHEYAVKELHYSEGSASRRVNAMRLLKDVSSAASALEKGSLNLCTVSTVQTFFKREKKERGKTYSPQEKQQLLETMENKSKTECEKILATISPASVIPLERKKVISETQTEVRVVLNQRQLDKLEKARSLLAHQNSDGSLAQLIEILADKVLDRVDPERKEARIQKRESKRAEKTVITPPAAQGSKPLENRPAAVNQGRATRKAIPAAIQRQVKLRDQGMCTFRDPLSGRRCCSRNFIQTDHIIPLAFGGTDELSNLRLLCFSHHKLETVRIFGLAYYEERELWQN